MSCLGLCTVQLSTNGGAEWEFVDYIGVATMGYGYSDAQVLRDGSVAIAFQKTFDPPVTPRFPVYTHPPCTI